MSTNLTAQVIGDTLTLSGSAADATGFVDIIRQPNSLSVADNGNVQTLVPVSGTELDTLHIDARDVTGAGVYIYSYGENSARRNLVGSDQGDFIVAAGAYNTNDKLYGHHGDDSLFGNEGNDLLHGGGGSDHLFGGAGDDIMLGGGGRDTDFFDGGTGIDTIRFVGARAEYEITLENGLYRISHIGGNMRDGVDYFANVELLQFTDQTVVVENPAPTNLSASISSKHLFVTGAASNSSGYVDIIHNSNSLSVEDNGNVQVLVPITGSELFANNIDARGLTGAGAWIESWSEDDNGRRLIGSAQNDYIYAGGPYESADSLYGYLGDDRLFGGAGDDSLYGGGGSDELFGGDGNDILHGGGQKFSDTYDGGAGTDTIVLSGARWEYDITMKNGLYQISHINGNSTDGVDYFINVELLQFTDQTFIVEDPSPTNLTAAIVDRKLSVTGDALNNSGYVEILSHASSLAVKDNGALPALVTVHGADPSLRHIDAKGVNGAGVWIESWSETDAGRTLLGSAQDDHIVSIGAHDTDDKLYGYHGNDKLFGHGGDDFLFGGNGADEMFGGYGNDTMNGGGGNDTDIFDGGAGTDTIVFYGARADYEIALDNGLYRISHVGGNQRDGVDYFANVELLQFTDQTVEVSELLF